MELRHYIHLLRKWTWLIALVALLFGGVVFLINRNMTPVYQTSTTLLVSPGSTQSLDNYSSLIASERLARTYSQLLQSEPVMTETQRQLDDLVAEGELETDHISGFSVSADPVRDTQLIQLRVTGTDPELIAVAANTLVEAFIEWQTAIQQSRFAESKANLEAEMEKVQASIEETETAILALQAQGEDADPLELSRLQNQLVQYRDNRSALTSSHANISLTEASAGDTVTVVSLAQMPVKPIRPRVMSNTLLAMVMGALLATGLAFFIEYMDDTVKTPEDLQTLDVNVIAAVQKMNISSKESDIALFTVNQPKSLVSEAYRTLRTNLQFSSLDNPMHSLVVTSAVATEGKTTTSANLAVVLAQAGKQVILVDGDLRRPSTHRLFGLPNRQGLTTALVEDPAGLNGHLQKTEVENLRLLTSGPVPPNPQELLGSQRMVEFIHQLEGEADIVLIDTPPVLVVSDANILAARTDGVLMVVNTGQTRRSVVQQAVEGLRQMGVNVIGGVLNMIDIREGRSYYYYSSYYYSHYYEDKERKGKRGLAGRLSRLTKNATTQKEETEPVQSQN